MVDPAAFPESFDKGGRSSEVMWQRTEGGQGNGTVNGAPTRFVAGGGGVEER